MGSLGDWRRRFSPLPADSCYDRVAGAVVVALRFGRVGVSFVSAAAGVSPWIDACICSLLRYYFFLSLCLCRCRLIFHRLVSAAEGVLPDFFFHPMDYMVGAVVDASCVSSRVAVGAVHWGLD